MAIGSKRERVKDKTAERYREVNRGRKWRGGQRERDRHGGKWGALDLKNGREVRERKREWKKDSRRWNRQLMDCLLWADSGMSTDSHLHEQALGSKESMSQPPSPPLSLTNTHGQNATKIWLYWTVLLYHTLTVRQAHTRTHTLNPGHPCFKMPAELLFGF